MRGPSRRQAIIQLPQALEERVDSAGVRQRTDPAGARERREQGRRDALRADADEPKGWWWHDGEGDWEYYGADELPDVEYLEAEEEE